MRVHSVEDNASAWKSTAVHPMDSARIFMLSVVTHRRCIATKTATLVFSRRVTSSESELMCTSRQFYGFTSDAESMRNCDNSRIVSAALAGKGTQRSTREQGKV